jgi:hypothetical protein
LFAPVSGEFTDVSVAEAVRSLTSPPGLEVKILGNSAKRVSFAFSERPLQVVLLDLQRLSGVPLEVAWLPQIGETDRFSFAANGKASRIALLFFAVGGQPFRVPSGTADKRVTLELNDVTLKQAKQELLKVMPREDTSP